MLPVPIAKPIHRKGDDLVMVERERWQFGDWHDERRRRQGFRSRYVDMRHAEHTTTIIPVHGVEDAQLPRRETLHPGLLPQRPEHRVREFLALVKERSGQSHRQVLGRRKHEHRESSVHDSEDGCVHGHRRTREGIE